MPTPLHHSNIRKRVRTMTKPQSNALRLATLLWIVWGLVHILAGIIILSSDASAGFAAVADAVDSAALAADYHPAVGGILKQHGFNLLWIGTVTFIGAFFIWRGQATAIWVTALVGGLADVGYLLFVDLPGYVRFFPGTLMTIVSASAIVLSFWAWRQLAKERQDH
ncbi:MAG: hypothetical protein AAGJ52_09265 [Pseudomonadota bacterium]